MKPEENTDTNSGGSETVKITTKAAITFDPLLCASDPSKHVTHISSFNPHPNSVWNWKVSCMRRGFKELARFYTVKWPTVGLNPGLSVLRDHALSRMPSCFWLGGLSTAFGLWSPLMLCGWSSGTISVTHPVLSGKESVNPTEQLSPISMDSSLSWGHPATPRDESSLTDYNQYPICRGAGR